MKHFTLSLAAPLALALLGATAPASANPEEAMAKAGCMACHAKDKKILGPAFKDIAAKYKGQANALALLVDKSRQGGKGSFGPVPMPPNPVDKISDADLKSAVAWILQQ